MLLFSRSHLLHVWLWTQIAVFLHVFVDIFNAYGTQALRPFSKKWVALGVINTFDPYYFRHSLYRYSYYGCSVQTLLLRLASCTSLLYSIIFYVLRFKERLKHAVHSEIQDEEFVIVAPTMRFFHWKVAAKSKTHFYVGRAYRRISQYLR